MDVDSPPDATRNAPEATDPDPASAPERGRTSQRTTTRPRTRTVSRASKTVEGQTATTETGGKEIREVHPDLPHVKAKIPLTTEDAVDVWARVVSHYFFSLLNLLTTSS